MTNKTASNRQAKHPWLRGISVSGYKSIKNEQSIEIRPLTILAGANSGGKSSIMQPVLLLKQTLDAPYDPGSLLLDGPNVRLTSADQLLSKKPHGLKEFFIKFDMGMKKVEVRFRLVPRQGLEVFSTTVSDGKVDLVISKDADLDKIKDILKNSDLSRWPEELYKRGELKVIRDRSFLTIQCLLEKGNISFPVLSPGERLAGELASLIHVPGLRGNPERDYKTTAVGDTFPGTFETYVASVISHWQSNKDDRLIQLGTYLEDLGLTWKVSADRRNETQVELKVGRLQHGSQGGARDLVSIADVGFGVSQTLPVLVALLAAQAGQLVYIEQPEIHLHPRAQRTLANIFADAAKRGVIVIVETHSALLIRGIQTLVAKDDLSQDLVKLHWFKRDALGATSVISADLDEAGAFGDWPEDFDEVELSSDNEYLSAAEAKLFKRQ